MMYRLFCLISALLFFFDLHSQIDYLQEAWNKQVNPLLQNSEVLHFKYNEDKEVLNHGLRHWATSTYKTEGVINVSPQFFQQSDTIKNDGQTYASNLYIGLGICAEVGYGSTDTVSVNKAEYNRLLCSTARYTPLFLLNYLQENKADLNEWDSGNEVGYETKIGNNILTVVINKENKTVVKIIVLTDYVSGFDTSLGDALNIYKYAYYVDDNGLYYPQQINIEEVNGKIKRGVKLLLSNRIKEDSLSFADFQKYAITDDATKSNITTTKFNDHIYLINLEHDETYAMAVEFNDFFAVIEAPLNSENGEFIIEEIRKINLDKPIKYFTAGHFHPHYLGGIRPFVYNNATVLSIAANKDYISEKISAPHTLIPDNLQLSPKPLVFEEIDEVKGKIITDEHYSMEIYCIGEKSAHTFDYLIFYFPQDKLLFQGDLAFLPVEGERTKAYAREKGLYSAIKDLNLDVETIIQSWPADGKYKSIFNFSELEKLIQADAENHSIK